MAAKGKGSSSGSRSFRQALTRKIGPLSVWVWAVLAFAGVWYYRNRVTATGQASTGTAAGVASGAGSGYYGAGSGGGGGGDLQPLTAPPTDQTGAPVSWDPTQAPGTSGGDTGTGGADNTNSIKSPPPPATIGGPSEVLPPLTPKVLNLKGGLTTPLVWGGQTFYTQTSFQAWARRHGTTVRAELAKHPAAAKVYAQLIPADITQTVIQAKPAPTRTRTRTGKPAARPADRPVSVRAIPAPRPASTTTTKKSSASRTGSSSKAAAALTKVASVPSPIPGAVHPPTAPPPAPRRLAVAAPELAPNQAMQLLNPTPAPPPPARTVRPVAKALPAVATEQAHPVAPRSRAVAV